MAETFDEGRRRHGEAIRAELAAAKERLTWPLDQLHALRDERLRELLAHARDRSSWHRARLADVDIDRISGDDLSAIPTMTKTDLMANWDAIVCEPRLTLDLANRYLAALAAGGDPAYLLDDVAVLATSGSSGHRAVIAIDYDGLASYAASIVRPVRWAREHGLAPKPRGDRLVQARMVSVKPVHMGGFLGLIVPARMVTFPPTMPLPAIVAGLNDLQPDELSGYASMLHVLALEARAGRLRIEPTTISQGGEALTPETRQLLRETFGAPIREIYGATEGFIAASLPDQPWLHLCEEDGVFELVDLEGRPVAPGRRAAKVLLTNVVNKVQPLIRYELDDETVLLPGPNPGPWTGRRIEPPTGRMDDWFDYAGVVVHPHVFRSVLAPLAGVVEYQVRQTATGAEVDVVAVGALDAEAVVSELTTALAGAGLEGARVEIRRVDNVERHRQSGKLRRFIPLK